MAHEYYYLGRSMGLTRIAGHKSFICIDTRSQEAFNYVPGVPVEPDEVSVMLRFLSPGDTFVDVGANFGLYSMIAAERLGQGGRLVAFEANPHTYEYLRHSVIANRLAQTASYKFENLAVTEEAGEIEFAFDPQALGGGHIKLDDGYYDDRFEFVVVPSIPLDQYFDQGQVIDFVKVDVEGHELSVLRGMTDVIERSPNIRLLLEYFTYTDEVVDYGRNVMAFLRAAGFGVCAVGPKGSLSVIPEGDVPTGNLYLLATRTPEADAAVPVGSLQIAPKGLRFHDVYARGEHALLTESGTLEFRARKDSPGTGTALFYGPYITLEAGSYNLVIDAEGVGSAQVSLTANTGGKRITSFVTNKWPCTARFSVRESVSEFEIVLHRTDSLQELVVRKISLIRTGSL